MLRKLSQLLDPPAKRRVIWVFAFMAVGAFLEAAGVGIVFPFVQLLTAGEIPADGAIGRVLRLWGLPLEASTILPWAAGTLIVVFFVKNVFLAYMHYSQFRFAFDSQVSLADRLLERYLRQPYVGLTKRNSSELLRNINGECMWVFNHVVIPLLVVGSELGVIASILVVLLLIAPQTTLVAAVIIVAAGGGFFLAIREPTARLGEAQQHHSGLMIRWVTQALSTTKESRVYGVEDYFIEHYRRSSQAYAAANTFLKTVQAMPRLVIETLAIGAVLAAAGVMLAMKAESATLLPQLGVFAVAALRLMPSMNRIIASVTAVRYFTPSVEAVHADLFGMADVDPGRLDPRLGAAQQQSTFSSHVELRDLSYTYPHAERPTLDHISLVLQRGSSVGLAGRSGAGKTTLVNVLLGLLPAQEGAILVDGIAVDPESRAWRDLVAYIPQQVYLLDDTVRRNVAFGLSDAKIHDERVWQALAAAQLDAFIREHPDGLDTRVGEDGVRFSGGERQRLGIARALYRNPEVLVLDEATAALDSQTERAVSDAIDALAGKKTMVLIAHRLSTLAKCAEIHVLDGGRIVDSGTHAELSERHELFATNETETITT